jgi:uncharacterized protein YjiS (DUF1127 family)
MEPATLIPGIGPADGAKLRGRVLSRPITATMAAVILWLERARQRRALQRLDDRMLMDVGLSRADVERESDKPFWQP